MKKLYAALASIVLSASSADAQQYCSPSFLTGCFGWTNQSISIGTINWTNSDCTLSDFTAMSTAVNAGASVPMSVTSGVWCGCAVWVDLNNDFTFQDAENLHYDYVGGDPSYTYNFNLTIPANTPTGAYRMRVIGPWGSDGFLNTNTNGFGPCGSFQYGNFDDFTLNVSGSSSVAEPVAGAVVARPNPTTGALILEPGAAAPVVRIVVRGMDGRVVLQQPVGANGGQVEIDMSALPNGAYMLECSSGSSTRVIRVLKQ
ncbi:MAG: T9SS type A sorting domain-containing protein [Flavobacteriales bacterium]